MYKTFTINQLREVTMNLTHNSNAYVPTNLKAMILITCIPPLKTFIPWTKPKCLKNSHIKQEIIGIHSWLPPGSKLSLKHEPHTQLQPNIWCCTPLHQKQTAAQPHRQISTHIRYQINHCFMKNSYALHYQ